MINRITTLRENFNIHYQQQIANNPFRSPLGGVVLKFRAPLSRDTISFGSIPPSLTSPKIKKSTAKALRETLTNVSTEITSRIRPYSPVIKAKAAERIDAAFKEALSPKSKIFKRSIGDLRFILEKDPALKEKDEKEAILYKSLIITFAHRVAHGFYKKGETTLARAISEATKELTGAEIHPGATIGRQIFIDHPSGLVVGEASKIGDRFHGHGNVLLGSDGVNTGKDRHPIIGNNVTIWPKASVHGGKNIGDGTIIGASAIVTENVPPNSIVVGQNLLVRLDGQKTKIDLKDYWKNLNKSNDVVSFSTNPTN